jgi:glycosyltransferase involved in cell wall biosynthesis
MDLPKISCYCATYGRPWALEEAIESFIRQDYEGEKELIVLNDYTGHFLICDHPDVLVFNAPARITPLGQKFNETVALCTGDILFPWEDDDIYLPNKISYTIDHMQNDFFHTHLGFMEAPANTLVVSGNYFHCNMAFSRTLWDRVGGYITIDRCELDINFLQRMKNAAGFTHHVIPPEDIFYIYRWGSVNSFHASGWGNTDVKVSDGAARIVAEQARKGIVPQGDYILQPHWSYDYITAAAHAAQIYRRTL